jgi:hypothetical protein
MQLGATWETGRDILTLAGSRATLPTWAQTWVWASHTPSPMFSAIRN